MSTILRAIAIAIAIAAALDPAIPVRRSAPLAVELVTGTAPEAAEVRDRLMSALSRDATVAHHGHADAVVIVDGRVDPADLRENVTVSAVTLPAGPNLRVLRAAMPSPSLLGEEALLDVDVGVQDLSGRTSALTVTQDGVEIGRIERTWTTAGRQRVGVPFIALARGTHRVRVTAVPFADEIRGDDNALDTRISTVGRPLRVAFVEPRPSWSVGFVRRVIESDPDFEVAALLRASRGIDVRAGDAPAALTPAALERFDVVVAGAPEELRPADLEAMRVFMAERGGTLFVLPDRRPSGPYASWVSPSGFDEVLLEAPVALESVTGGRALRASEFAIPRATGLAIRALATLADGRAAIVSRPVGDGRLIFSGALDAWRFRGDEAPRFAAFWRASIGAAALAAPPRVRVELDPPVVKAGGDTRVIARVRRTELEHNPDGSIDLPVIRAVATRRQGKNISDERVRLWPRTELGVFEGRFSPVESGTYSVHAITDQAQDVALRLEAEIPEAVRADAEEAAMVAAATGGVVTPADDLTPLVNHLRAVRRPETRVTRHPMRSGWWMLPFALALCVEWALRRRRGER